MLKLTKGGILRINFRNFPEEGGRLRCNFKCSYCMPKGRKIVEYPYTEEHFRRTKVIWDAFSQIEDQILVRVNFKGETFIDEWAKKCASYINKIPNVAVCEFITNNSVDPKTYLGDLDTKKTTFNCSFHPEFISIERFLDNALTLKNSGCDVVVNVCAVPQFIKKIPEYRATFKRHGIHLILQGFLTPGSDYMGKRYPEHYTNDERNELIRLFSTDEEYEYFVDLKETRGFSCNAGVDMINVFLDGDVRRCFTGAIGKVDDLISGRVKLKDKPYPCHEDTCTCYPHFIGLSEFRAQYPLSERFVDYFDFSNIKPVRKKTFVRVLKNLTRKRFRWLTLLRTFKKFFVCKRASNIMRINPRFQKM